MLFFGGFTTGITGSRNIGEGLINGGVLSLITYLALGFIIGISLFILMGITSAIASAFSSIGTSTASNIPTTTSTSSISQDFIFFIIKSILIIIISFFAGIGGGALGAWIKGVIK